MADDLTWDLADKLAQAFTIAAGRIADRSVSAMTPGRVRDELADELRRVLPQPDRAEVVLERASGIARAVMHAMTEYRTGQTIGRCEFDMRDAIADALAYGGEDVPEPDPVAAIMREKGITDEERIRRIARHYYSMPPERQCKRPGCWHTTAGGTAHPDDLGYAAPDYTPDERHRHTIWGQVWEHAHEGGHEAHGAVPHDLSGADRIASHKPAQGRCQICGHVGWLWRYRPIQTQRVCYQCCGQPNYPSDAGDPIDQPKARPEPPSAVSEALDAARVLLHRLKNLTTEEFAHGREEPEREALADALAAVVAAVDEIEDAERARRYALGKDHGAMGGAL